MSPMPWIRAPLRRKVKDRIGFQKRMRLAYISLNMPEVITTNRSQLMAQEVLLIEADPALGRLMRQVIQETIPDFSTQVAVDSTEALDYLFCTGAFTHREPELPA